MPGEWRAIRELVIREGGALEIVSRFTYFRLRSVCSHAAVRFQRPRKCLSAMFSFPEHQTHLHVNFTSSLARRI